MKKNIVLAAAIGCAMLLTSCAGVPSLKGSGSQNAGQNAASSGSLNSLTTNSSGGQNLIGSLLSGLMGNLTPISTASVKGTWTYSSPECRFESENFLTQAGGEVMANKVENQLGTSLSKLGFKQGSTTFVFDGAGKCTIQSGAKPILIGSYSIDSNTRAINIKGTTGLVSLQGTAYMSGNTLTLLFDADKLVGFIKGAGSLLGGSNSAVSSLFNYDGMKLGMNLNR